VPLQPRLMPGGVSPWHNYWNQSSFGLVLVDQVCRYLAGSVTVGERNFLLKPGQEAAVAVPTGAAPPWKLQGPGVAASESAVTPREGQTLLKFPQATTPGNYLLSEVRRDGGSRPLAAFSLNVPEEESRLERVDVEEIERALGEGTVLPVGRVG